MLPILSLPGLVRLFLCQHRQTVIAGASARRQAPLPTEHTAHRPNRMGLGCWGGWHGWYAVPCRCDIRLRLDISCCDQRGLYGDSTYDGPVVRVGSMVGHGQLTSGLSRSCSVSNYMFSRSRRTPPAFIGPCLPSPADRPPCGPGWVHEIKHDGFRMQGIVSKRLGSRYRSGRSADRLKFKNPQAPAVQREAEEDWGRRRWR